MLVIKKLPVLILTLIMLFSLVACRAANNARTNTDTASSDSSTRQEKQADTSGKNATETASEGQTQAISATKKILVAYFSRVGNSSFSKDVDAVSSASLRVRNAGLIGNTEIIANRVLRVIHTGVNLLLIAVVLMLVASVVLISRKVFAFIRLEGGLNGRQMHMLATYWGFILMSVHLGMHWGMFMGAAQKLTRVTSQNRGRTIVLRMVAGFIAAYGVFASFSRDVGSKLILYYTFDFWNYDQSAVIFFIDNLSIMGLYVCVTYYSLKFVQNKKGKTIMKGMCKL